MTITAIIISLFVFLVFICVVLYFIGKDYRKKQDNILERFKYKPKKTNKKRSTGSAYRDFI